ncbi:VOC family protein [Blastopirellula retiformator]|uniref:Putative lyase n=1 Tax=Blastopirellula retiformator TaxID=2527970 RepID=A0A5C5UUL6_9BACT|nr:VOC family protein [Blastopirellula retiformator]TWT30071.1 putative lyase [Blastopirellula retiformator]
MTPPLPIRRLQHIAVAAADAVQSRDFYRDVLGFREVERPPFDFRGAWLCGYGIQIHVIERTTPLKTSIGDIDTRASHLAFEVEDPAAITTILEGHGIPYIQRVNAGNIHQTFFHDPDGNPIEVAVYPTDPPFLP